MWPAARRISYDRRVKNIPNVNFNLNQFKVPITFTGIVVSDFGSA